MMLDFSIAACLVAAVASLLRGKKYVHDVDAVPVAEGQVNTDLPERIVATAPVAS